MDWGPDNHLYGPSRSSGSAIRDRIVRIDVDSGAIETVAHGLSNSVAVKFNSEGQLHAAVPGEIRRVDLLTGDTELVAKVFVGLDSFAFDSTDRLFVSEPATGAIAEVLDNGEMRTVVQGGMIAPGGLAVLPTADDEVLYLGDWLSLKAFDSRTGAQVFAGQLFAPGAATVSGHRGQLVLSHSFTGRVEVWDPVTKATTKGYGGFSRPINAIGFGDGLVVAELGAEPGTARVLLIEGDLRREIATTVGLDTPSSLVAQDGNLWVADWRSGSLYQVAANGELLDEPKLVVTGLSRPEGAALDINGRLLIVETEAGRLTSVDPSTGERTTVVEGLEIGAKGIPFASPTHIFAGVAVDQAGTIYVSGDRAGVVYRIERSLR